MILRVHLSNKPDNVTEVPINPETTCKDVVDMCKEPGEEHCHLAEDFMGTGKLYGNTVSDFDIHDPCTGSCVVHTVLSVTVRVEEEYRHLNFAHRASFQPIYCLCYCLQPTHILNLQLVVKIPRGSWLASHVQTYGIDVSQFYYGFVLNAHDNSWCKENIKGETCRELHHTFAYSFTAKTNASPKSVCRQEVGMVLYHILM